MIALLLIILVSFSTAASPQKTECTEGLKAKATLKFSECQEPLLPLKQCYKLYPETLGTAGPRLQIFLDAYGNNSHEADYCKTRKNMTSCEHLTYLTSVCGAHYDTCHTKEEKREIIRMWIKQFVQGTHELYWEFAFNDNNKEITDGNCNHILNEYFDKEEVAEVTSLVNTGPNTFKNCSWEIQGLKNKMICSTKLSNLTKEFGNLIDQEGNRIGYNNHDHVPQITKPSHWQYCSWKMQHSINDEGLYPAIIYLARCDGKCNTNDGDDQKWISSSNIDVETNEFKDFYDPMIGDNHLFSCIWRAGWNMQDRVSEFVETKDLDNVKMQLCKPFKTLLENCSIPMTECVENIAIKEIVLAEILKDMVATTKRAMEIVKEHTQPDFLGDFTYDDCVIFGGEVAGSTLRSVKLGQIVLLVTVAYVFLY